MYNSVTNLLIQTIFKRLGDQQQFGFQSFYFIVA